MTPAVFAEVRAARETWITCNLGKVARRLDVPRTMAKAWPDGSVLVLDPKDAPALAPGARRYWLALTNGLTDPHVDRNDPGGAEEDRVAGLGYELLAATRDEPSWAASLLLDLVRYVITERRDLHPGDTMDFGESIARGSACSAVVFAPPRFFHGLQLLPTGHYGWLHVLPVTADELAWGKRESTPALVELLYRTGAAPDATLARKSVLVPGNAPVIEQVLVAARGLR